MDPAAMRATAIAGIVFPLLLIGGFSLQPQEPPYDSTDSQAWADYYANAPATGDLGFALEGFAWLAFLLFLGGLGALLAERESARFLSRSATGAGLAFAAVALVSWSLRWTLVWDDTSKFGADAVHNLAVAGENLKNGFFSVMIFAAVLVAGLAGLSMLRHRSAPRWLAWLSLVLAGAAFLSAWEGSVPALGIAHIPSTLGFMVWPLLVGLALLPTAFRRANPAAPPA